MNDGATVNRGGWVALAAAAGLVGSLDTMVNIAFPAITDSFTLDVAQIGWVVVCYVLTYASLLVLMGRLADAFGHVRLLLAGLVVTAVGVAWCGVATAFPLFLAGRVVQGVGAALVLGSAPALVTLSVGEERRSRALGTFQMGVALGAAVGPAIGGVLVSGPGWRWVYLIRVPVAIGLALAVLVALRAGPAPAPPPAAAGSPRPRLDLVGAVGLGAASAAGLFGLTRARDQGWDDALVLSGLLGAVVLAIGWFVVERRTEQPALDPRLFGDRGFALANGLNFLANATSFAIWLLAPYYLLTVRGHAPVIGGAILGAAPCATALASALAGRLEPRIGGARLATIGLVLEAAGLATIARLGADSPAIAVVGALALAGFGLGLFSVPNLGLVMGTIPRAAQGVAGGLAQMVRTIGLTAGVTAAGQFFAARRTDRAGDLGVDAADPLTFVPAFRDTFLAVAVVCSVAAALSLARPRSRPPVAAVRSASA